MKIIISNVVTTLKCESRFEKSALTDILKRGVDCLRDELKNAELPKDEKERINTKIELFDNIHARLLDSINDTELKK